ncbi:MAG: rhomboid family intramembrane serine protease [Planctomycetota bacterium]
MGIYDRDYYRDEDASTSAASGLPQTFVVRLILANAALFLLDMFFGGSGHRLTGFLALSTSELREPWHWWRLLSYAFAHDPRDIGHIASNMLGLWFFGRELESLYGRWEFLRIYLFAAVFSGAVWLLRHGLFAGAGPTGTLVGASGSVVALVILFAFRFPRQQVLFMMILPMPAWVLGVIYVAYNLFGASQTAGGISGVAYDVHLAGAAFAAIYHLRNWNLGTLAQLFPWVSRLTGRRRGISGGTGGSWRRPQSSNWDDAVESVERELRVYRPESVEPARDDLDRRADLVLAKLHQFGDGSLTADERSTLEAYSRRLRERRR